MRQHSVSDLRALSLPVFWTLPDRDVNALLVALFGVGRLIARGNEVSITPP